MSGKGAPESGCDMITLSIAYAVFIAGFVLCDLLAGDLPAILYAIAFYPVFLILYGGVKK